ncbi:hypothetical protein BDY17DRAFT_288228 [Neohortaea acidophila]|uniref:NYN domain-containing protein n=1 Tax=Neohortaea acidophila TaxID=245834 RepID=A0A6A6Q433_9PEZI|nr:uncharacterized protein BDY17DRAFT_288228 [Neohortaea acidophila]KAF2487042.1 hypothetical protein BDY17DRAFT_288228 [Neohortaea acidophila]
MTATTEAKPWDFSHVLDLVNTLSTRSDPWSPPAPANKHDAPRQSQALVPFDDEHSHEREQHNAGADSRGLGDFSKLWHFFGTSTPPPEPSYPYRTQQPRNVDIVDFPLFANYASDGAFDAISTSKKKTSSKAKEAHHPHDHSSTEDQAGDTLSDGSFAPDTPTLTKSQRKKKNRKERRAQLAAALEENATRAVSMSESEAKAKSGHTPAKKASVHNISTPPTNTYNLRPRDGSGKAICEAPQYWTAPSPASAKPTTKRLEAAKKPQLDTSSPKLPLSKSKATSTAPSSLPATLESAVKRLEDAKKTLMSTSPPKSTLPNSKTTPAKPVAQTSPAIDIRRAHDTQHSTPQNGVVKRFLPSSVPPAPFAVDREISAPPSVPSIQATSLPKRNNAIQPIVARSGEDRHWALLIKLIGDFYEDRKYLIAPMNLTTHNNNPKGIHVFVDASNIFIGFHDQLKRSRGIPSYVHVPAVDMSFDALALLMERRRPVAKRVLVGSTPHLPAFDKAKAVGYECSILEKVYKARELTERQIYFKEQERAYHYDRNASGKRAKAPPPPPANHVATLLNGTSGSAAGSSSETSTPPQYAPARMIEQGVDEILHLKILESVIDAEEPSTIVLATGDAAQAEYSEGFMAMAERALKKGWTVELVSWSKNISSMYTRREWTGAWGGRFRVVELDDYAEELLDM